MASVGARRRANSRARVRRRRTHLRLRFWRSRTERDFRREVDAHLELEAEQLAAQRDLSPHDARDAARRAFGNVTIAQERFYESMGWAWLDRLSRHLRYTGRTLRNHPAFAIAAVLTLGIGSGVNTAVFTVLYSSAIRALPVRGAGRIVNVYQQLRGRYSREVRGTTSWIGYPEFLAYARDSHTIEASRR